MLLKIVNWKFVNYFGRLLGSVNSWDEYIFRHTDKQIHKQMDKVYKSVSHLEIAYLGWILVTHKMKNYPNVLKVWMIDGAVKEWNVDVL